MFEWAQSKKCFLLQWDPGLCFTRIMPGPCLTHTTAPWNVDYSHCCMSWLVGGPMLRGLWVQTQDRSPSPGQTCSPMPEGAASAVLSPSSQQGPGHLHPPSCPPFFYGYGRVAGQQQSMVSSGTVRPWNTGFTESEEIKRHNWEEKPNGGKPQQGKQKTYSKELKLIAKNLKGHREQSGGLISLHMFKTPTDGVMGPTGWSEGMKESNSWNYYSWLWVSNWEKERHSAVAW